VPVEYCSSRGGKAVTMLQSTIIIAMSANLPAGCRHTFQSCSTVPVAGGRSIFLLVCRQGINSS
jgi:hypothetical protein